MSVVSIVVVHRHGSRFPSSSAPKNLGFPISDDFWSSYKMMLTPEGTMQLYKLGKELRKEYPNIFLNDPLEASSSIKVHTSNTSRTIMSCLSLLNGALPNIPKYLSHNGDRCSSIYNLTENNLNNKNNTLGIRIRIEEEKNKDNLFHMGKMSNKLKKWRSNNINTSPVIQKILLTSECKNLLDKLYTMTMSKKLSPSLPLIERFINITDYNTLVRYSRCSNTTLIPNDLCIELNSDEILLIEKYSQINHYHKFCPWNGKKDEGIGSKSSGLLLSEISSFLKSKIKGARIYSAHDTTLLAISSALGWIVPSPNFSAYYIFELLSTGEIRIKFNPEPDTIKLSSLLPILWKEKEHFLNYDEIFGNTFFNDFILSNLNVKYSNIKNFIFKFYFKSITKRDIEFFHDIKNKNFLSEKEFINLFRRFEIDDLTNKEISNIFFIYKLKNKISRKYFNFILG